MRGTDYEALARQELASVLDIFEYWTEGNRSLRLVLETERRDSAALLAAQRRLQATLRILEPHVSVKAKHVYAPYCAALAGSELAAQLVTERRYEHIRGLVDYARLLHRRALEDTAQI